jgi:hypothetical protein
MAKDLGALTAQLYTLKESRAALTTQVKETNADIMKVERTLLDEMQKQGLYKAGNKDTSVYISRQVVPKVTDWDALYAYIAKHGYFHLLEKRASRTAYREQYENGQSVPGLEPVIFDELRTRKEP